MENLSAKESLMLIEEIINTRKKKYEENGLVFIFWGCLIALAGMVQFSMYLFDFYFDQSGWVWAVLMTFGFILTFLFYMRKGIKAKKESQTQDWMGWLWFVSGVCAMVSGFSHTVIEYKLILIYSPFAMVALATALQLKNILWIGTSVVSIILIYSVLFINYGYCLILLSVVLACLLYLIPGIKLYSDYKKRNHV